MTPATAEVETVPTGRAPGVDLAPLMEIDRGSFKLTRYFEFSETGFQTLSAPPMEVCGDLSEFLKIVHSGIQWMIGDYVNLVESLFGEKASQMVDAAHLPEASIKVYRWVAAKVEPARRRKELSFEHHVAVAALESTQQVFWLQKALDGDDGAKWSSARLKREIKNADGGTALGAASAEYEVIVTCDSEADQEACCRQLENLGRKNYHAKKPRQ